MISHPGLVSAQHLSCKRFPRSLHFLQHGRKNATTLEGFGHADVAQRASTIVLKKSLATVRLREHEANDSSFFIASHERFSARTTFDDDLLDGVLPPGTFKRHRDLRPHVFENRQDTGM